jgi:hypothetical protein
MGEWKVHPHGELRELVSGLWIVTGSLPGMPLPRNMVVYRLPDGGLLLHSVICLDEAGMQKLESLGRPAMMIVPSDGHRADAPAWKERYPDLRVLCPVHARAGVEKVVKVDATCEDVLPGLGVAFHVPAGFAPGELVYELPVEGGKALVFNDVLGYGEPLPGLMGRVFTLLGVPGGGLGRPRIVGWLRGKDRGAFKPWLEPIARRDDVVVLTVSHGPPILGRDQVKANLASAIAKL